MLWCVVFHILAIVESSISTRKGCIPPGQTPPEICDPPAAAKFQRVINLPGRRQWLDRDGYCGANSIQMILLKYGAYVSQDLIRNAVNNEMIVMGNCAQAIKNLKFTYAAWNGSSYHIPQVDEYLTWLKHQLVAGHPTIWFVYCKGDPNIIFDHIEPVFGIYSNHTLTDPHWYSDDILVHNSDYDQNHYYRTFASLPDSHGLKGNCAIAPPGHGHNEMYPCIPNDARNFGYAVTGIVDPTDKAIPTELVVSNWGEPDLDQGEPPEKMNAIVKISELTQGVNYTLYRWDDVNECPGCKGLGYKYVPSIPSTGDYVGANHTHIFIALDTFYIYNDPIPFLSSNAVYYRCVPSNHKL